MDIQKFWQQKSFCNYALYPLALLWQLGTFIRSWQQPYKSSKVVICLGNINLGGSGKTPTAITIGLKLQNLGYKVAFLNKGYKGSLRGAKFVEQGDSASLVGDEALLLSQHLPTMVSKKLKVGLQKLESSNFEVIVIDDGLQNPTIHKDYNIVVVNGSYGFGNGLLFPMGALRESIDSGLNKANALIILEEDKKNLQTIAKTKNLLIIKGYYKALECNNLLHKKYYAFCGIGMPKKFKDTLQQNGLQVKKFKAFSDHYSYSETDIIKLLQDASHESLSLITTMKDYVKIKNEYKSQIIPFEITANLCKNEVLYTQLVKLIESNRV